MGPAPQVSDPFTIETSIGKYSDTRLSLRGTFALYLKLTGTKQSLGRARGVGSNVSCTKLRSQTP